MPSEYEQLRLRNLEDNKRILAELGLLNNPFKPLRPIKKAPKRKREWQPVKNKSIKLSREHDTPKRDNEKLDELGSVYGERRRSSRIKGIPAKDISEDITEPYVDEEEEDLKKRRLELRNRPMVYGLIPGVEVGTLWQTRIECNSAGIHRPTVAGIHPGPDGAYSIALSGGYEDDIDLGECFTYTGEGGRDLKGTVNKPKNLRTAPQSKDQCLSRGNAALVNSVETGEPVRVIRGYKSRSEYAPEEGYRYDGLYCVEKHWFTTGLAGFGVFKFALTRIKDQAPPPWTYSEQETDDAGVLSDKSEPNADNPDDTENKKPEPKKELISEKPSADVKDDTNTKVDGQDNERLNGDLTKDRVVSASDKKVMQELNNNETIE